VSSLAGERSSDNVPEESVSGTCVTDLAPVCLTGVFAETPSGDGVQASYSGSSGMATCCNLEKDGLVVAVDLGTGLGFSSVVSSGVLGSSFSVESDDRVEVVLLDESERLGRVFVFTCAAMVAGALGFVTTSMGWYL